MLASRRLEAAAARNVQGMGGMLQAGAELLGRQKQLPTQNHSEFEREQELLKERFHLDIGDLAGKARSPGPRSIPKGLRPAQGFFDGATHQVTCLVVMQLPVSIFYSPPPLPPPPPPQHTHVRMRAPC